MMSLRIILLATLFLSGWSVLPLFASLPSVAVKAISTGELQAPTSITNAGDGSGRLFVCEQRGQIRIIQNGMLLPQVFLDLSAKIVPFEPTSYLFPMTPSYDERGLLGLAFHPSFASSGSPGYRKFYVFYSAPSPNARGNPTPPATAPAPVDCRTIISEFQVSSSANVADATSERVLLSFDKPQPNHNGGQLEFGPDGFLYFSTGDGGGSNDISLGHTGATNPQTFGNLGNAQDKTSLMGKINRIDPLGTNGPGGQYGIPATNPFVGAGGGVREEIYAYGLRNTWRFSFDTGTGGTGKLFAADVGQSRVEEVNIINAGGNYGWHAREGSFTLDNAVENALLNGGDVRVDSGKQTLPGGAVLTNPIAQYAHPSVTIGTPALPKLGTSITGGFCYRGADIPALIGKYVFGDYNFGTINSGTTQGTLLGIEETSPGVWSTPAAIAIFGANPFSTTHLMAFGRDEQGELYVATQMAQGPRDDPNTTQPSGAVYKIVPASTITKTVNADKDNTIYSEDAAFGSFTSDALGYLYVGRTGSANGSHVRRALVSFDVSGQVPAGAVIQSAQFRLNTETIAASATGKTFSIYRLSQTWGEGTSENFTGGFGVPATTGDATWTRRFYNTLAWSTAGGAHAVTASASGVLTTGGVQTWGSTSQMVSDVQGWLDTPSGNAGWIVRGDETTDKSAVQFHSVQKGSVRPSLVLSYTATPGPTPRESWLLQYFPPGHYVEDSADLDRDGLRNLAEYAFALSPLAADPPDAGLKVSVARSQLNNLFTMSFRRDPRATDLTYQLQTSPDMVQWTTIVQSVGGNAPTGASLVSDADVAGESPIKLVTVRETLTSRRRFARVEVTRQP
ncbi:MAG: hypothetical protein JWO08_3884 [Verrucomicrobiaceae bacterium]|nr:hypothetical protein [Verrucomicrobiaceae bacterium]